MRTATEPLSSRTVKAGLLPVALALSFLAAIPVHARTLSCGNLLASAVDTRIPASLTDETRLLLFTPHGPAEESRALALLSAHVASVPIGSIPGAWVGLTGSVGQCLANGCEAFVYLTSSGISAMSRPMRVDGLSTVLIWDYTDPVHDPFVPPTFTRNRAGGPQQVVVNIGARQVVAGFSSAIRYHIYWAGFEAVVDDPDRWLEHGDTYMAIPLFGLGEQHGAPQPVCP
jgi:hypothetical protein